MTTLKSSGGGNYVASDTVIQREDLLSRAAYERLFPGRSYWTADGMKHPSDGRRGYDEMPVKTVGSTGVYIDPTVTRRENAEKVIASEQDLVAKLKQFGKDEYEDQTILYVSATFETKQEPVPVSVNAKEVSLRKYYGGETPEEEAEDNRRWYTYVLVKDGDRWHVTGTYNDLPRQPKHWGELVEEIFVLWAECEIQQATDFTARPLITDGRALRRL